MSHDRHRRWGDKLQSKGLVHNQKVSQRFKHDCNLQTSRIGWSALTRALNCRRHAWCLNYNHSATLSRILASWMTLLLHSRLTIQVSDMFPIARVTLRLCLTVYPLSERLQDWPDQCSNTTPCQKSFFNNLLFFSLSSEYCSVSVFWRTIHWSLIFPNLLFSQWMVWISFKPKNWSIFKWCAFWFVTIMT